VRIALVTDTYVPQVNGVTTVVHRIVRLLDRTGHQVGVVAPRSPHADGGGGGSGGEGVLRVPSVPFPPYPDIRRYTFVTVGWRRRHGRKPSLTWPRTFRGRQSTTEPLVLRIPPVHARPLRLPCAGALALVSLASTLPAQAPNIRVAGRIQAHYRMSSGDSTANYNDAAVNNGFEIRRLRIQADVRFGDNISLAIQPSFEMGSLRMRDAYLRVGLTRALGLTLGQEKSPFQRYELTSSNTLPSIERGVRILGLSGREALNDLLFNNGYVSHDLGAALEWAAPRFAIKVALQNGSRESAPDVNNAKSVFARATGVVLTNADDQPTLQVGGSFASRDRAVCSTCTGTAAYYPDSSLRTTALGLDIEWGGFRPGLHVIADFATGDNVPLAARINSGRNTGNVRNSADSNVVTFRAVHLVGAYRIRTSGADTRLVQAVEPALRIDYTDPNTDASDDEGLLVTPAVNVHFTNTVILRAGLDFYRYTDTAGTSRSAREVKVSWQANF